MEKCTDLIQEKMELNLLLLFYIMKMVRYIRSMKGILSERKLAEELNKGRQTIRRAMLGESYKNVV